LSEEQIQDAADSAWLEWHEAAGFDASDDDDYIPAVSPLWRRAFSAGAKWMEAKGEK